MAGAKSVDAKNAKEREGRQGGQKEKSGIGQKRKRRAVRPFSYPVRGVWSIVWARAVEFASFTFSSFLIVLCAFLLTLRPLRRAL
jgi:hypothetical protein